MSLDEEGWSIVYDKRTKKHNRRKLNNIILIYSTGNNNKIKPQQGIW